MWTKVSLKGRLEFRLEAIAVPKPDRFFVANCKNSFTLTKTSLLREKIEDVVVQIRWLRTPLAIVLLDGDRFFMSSIMLAGANVLRKLIASLVFIPASDRQNQQ